MRSSLELLILFITSTYSIMKGGVIMTRKVLDIFTGIILIGVAIFTLISFMG